MIRWVKTFYSNISSCNINNGICTEYYNSINRGVRQGDPLSPYFFIVAVELLAIAIRKSDDIRGVRIGDTESKVIQHADDLTATLSDVESAEALLTLLKHFETCSGLKVNYTKTEAMWIGSCSNETSSPLGLKWRKNVKALGIHFSYDTAEMTPKNFFEKLKSIQEQIQIWKWRGLSLYGKVTIFKTLLIPKFICVASVLCTPNEFVRKLKEMIYKFLWNGPDKVARAATINSINFGGLNMTDFETSIKSLRLAWIGRYLNENSAPWKSFFNID